MPSHNKPIRPSDTVVPSELKYALLCIRLGSGGGSVGREVHSFNPIFGINCYVTLIHKKRSKLQQNWLEFAHPIENPMYKISFAKFI